MIVNAKKKTVLVTGGAGYIGSHVCKKLHQSGYTPITIDNLSSGNKDAVKWGPFEHADIRDTDALSKIIQEHAPDAIMHFAALIQVADSVVNPSEYYDNNVLGSHSLLEAARANNIKNIVFSSTAAVYGLAQDALIKEDTALKPINPYGQTKLTMENMIRDYSNAYKTNYAILRYFNAAGADPEGETGFDYPKDTHLVPILMNVVAGDMPQIKIYGTDYNTPDGTAVRDYIHVTDLADAHVKALEYITSKNESVTLNLGTGQGYSVQSVVATCKEATGKSFTVELSDRRAGDPATLVADASRAYDILDWTPRLSDIESIIKTAWSWKQHKIGRDTA